MDIIGNGVDIIKNSRIDKSLKIKGFINRIFTKQEIKQAFFDYQNGLFD